MGVVRVMRIRVYIVTYNVNMCMRMFMHDAPIHARACEEGEHRPRALHFLFF